MDRVAPGPRHGLYSVFGRCRVPGPGYESGRISRCRKRVCRPNNSPGSGAYATHRQRLREHSWAIAALRAYSLMVTFSIFTSDTGRSPALVFEVAISLTTS